MPIPRCSTNDAPRRPGRGGQVISNCTGRVSNHRWKARLHLRSIDLAELNRHALPHLPELVGRWLPCGRRRGQEYVALNPRRADCALGTFALTVSYGA